MANDARGYKKSKTISEYKFHEIFHDKNYKYYVEEFALAFKAIVR